MNDNTKVGIFVIVILLLLYSKKLTESVTATVGGIPVNPANVGAKDFDYSVCGIAPEVSRRGLAIRVCTDPITGNLYPIESYPNNGDSAQVVFLKEQALIDENLRLNTPTSGATYGPSLALKVIDVLSNVDPITGGYTAAL